MIFLDMDFNLSEGTADLAANNDGLVVSPELRAAALLSLHTNRQVETEEAQGFPDRGGWWGGAFPIVPGDIEGSRLWLLEQAGASETTRRRAEEYATEALRWMVDDELLTEVLAKATLSGNAVILDIDLVYSRNTRERLVMEVSVGL